MWHPATILLEYAAPRLAQWFWSNRKNVLDSTPLEPVFSLNCRQGSNAGKGRGYRKQPDPNSGKFRAYDAVIPHLMN
jgi:hypothetical protein